MLTLHGYVLRVGCFPDRLRDFISHSLLMSIPGIQYDTGVFSFLLIIKLAFDRIRWQVSVLGCKGIWGLVLVQ